MLGALSLYGLLLYLVNAVSVVENSIETDFKEPPPHEFIGHEQNFAKDKTTKKTSCKLIIEPHVFSQRRKAKRIGDIATFSCNACKKQKKYVTAKAKKIGENENDYILVDWPSLDDHDHVTSPVYHLKTKFLDSLYEKIKQNPSADIPKLYEETRAEFCRDLSDEESAAFFAIIPSLRNVQGNAYRYVRDFIPKQPKDFVSFVLNFWYYEFAEQIKQRQLPNWHSTFHTG